MSVVVSVLLSQRHAHQVAARAAASVAAQASEKARTDAVAQAARAQTQYSKAWQTNTSQERTATDAVRIAVNTYDLVAATAGEAKNTSGMATFINTVQSIQFPVSMEQDVRALLTAATNWQVASESASNATSWDAFNADIDDINRANTALNDADVAVTRDLQRLATE